MHSTIFTNLAAVPFSARDLMVGEAENDGGAVDLAEKINQPASCRLTRAAETACADM